MAELTTVADDEAVIHDGPEALTYSGLEPDAEHEIGGFTFRTLPQVGERLATVATVNDVHFGETVCGIMDGIPDGPFFSVEPGAEPYPELMNRGAIAEISALDPDAVVVKGDLTNDGLDEEYAAFLAAYQPAFGDRLHHVRGNHDAYRHQTYAPEGPQRIDVDGLTIALLDTTIPGHTTGQVPDEQLEWLEDLAAEADRPDPRPRAPPRLEPGRQRQAGRLLRHPPGRLRAVHRRRGPAPGDHRLRRRSHPPEPGATLRGDGRPALHRGRVREGLPGQLGGVPRVRGRRAPGPPPHLHPRGAGVDGADPRHVRGRVRRVRLRRAR